MEFRAAFPIAIIDEDYEGKHAAGRGMQQLAAAIEKEGFRVVGGISYADAQRLSKIFNTESCWLVSIDGSEDVKTRWQILEEVLASKRARNDRLPIFLFGDELTAEMVPANVLKHANAFMRLFEDSPEFLARTIARSAQLYLDRLPPPMFKALMDYTFQASYSWHTPGHGGGTAFARARSGRCSTSSSARTRCGPTFRCPSARSGPCSITPARSRRGSETRRAFSERMKRSLSLAARPQPTKSSGMEWSARATSSSATGTATNPSCIR